MLVPEARGDQIVFGYHGQDGILRETRVDVDRRPDASEISGERAVLRWTIELGAGSHESLTVVATPSSGEQRPAPRSLTQAARELDADQTAWSSACTRIDAKNDRFQSLIGASVRDMYALLTPASGGRIAAAGIPWYVAPFGRDSLLTAYECLSLNPQLARDTLITLAELQAHADEPWRDAEPGKILHELRAGELARAGLVPHTPYYGTVDATPLFVLLTAAYFAWTATSRRSPRLRPALDRALDWIDRYGDADSDGFVEYRRRSPAGLLNQGWKDSEDSIMHADGTPAEGPIALVEVQGYVYLAKLRIADVYASLGEPDRARELRAQAQTLREAFNEAFWMPDEGTLALALDGRKRQVRERDLEPRPLPVLRNRGTRQGRRDRPAPHGARHVLRLGHPHALHQLAGLQPDELSQRLDLAPRQRDHRGRAQAGGAADAALRVATALFDIAARSRDFRLAELYCGFVRSGNSEIVGYPVACMPQAWATAAPFMLLQAMLGITAYAPAKTLAVIEPRMPDWLEHLELRGLRVGDARVGLAFTQLGGITGFSLLDQRGELTVTMSPAPR